MPSWRRMARRFLAHLDADGYSRRSITRKTSAVRTFYTDASRRGEAESNPFEGISRLRLSKPLPHALPSRTVVQGIESIDTSTPEGMRDRALLDALYATGLRIHHYTQFSRIRGCSSRQDCIEDSLGCGSHAQLRRIVPEYGRGNAGRTPSRWPVRGRFGCAFDALGTDSLGWTRHHRVNDEVRSQGAAIGDDGGADIQGSVER